MMNDELIKSLRYCISDDYVKRGCCKCPINKDGMICGTQDDAIKYAADAIERLMEEVDRKDKALQAWTKTWEQREDNAIRHICDHCDTPIDVRLKEGACEDCPIITLVKEIFDEQPT